MTGRKLSSELQSPLRGNALRMAIESSGIHASMWARNYGVHESQITRAMREGGTYRIPKRLATPILEAALRRLMQQRIAVAGYMAQEERE
jgi:hypothetical protein